MGSQSPQGRFAPKLWGEITYTNITHPQPPRGQEQRFIKKYELNNLFSVHDTRPAFEKKKRFFNVFLTSVCGSDFFIIEIIIKLKKKKVKSSMAKSLPVENLLPQNVGSIINYLQ